MPKITTKEHESVDAMLRRFKRACEKAGFVYALKRLQYYEKPTEKRKRKKAAAVKREKKRVGA